MTHTHYCECGAPVSHSASLSLEQMSDICLFMNDHDLWYNPEWAILKSEFDSFIVNIHCE